MKFLRLRGFMNYRKSLSTSTQSKTDIFNPTDEHRSLRSMIRSFVENEVDPQAKESNRSSSKQYYIINTTQPTLSTPEYYNQHNIITTSTQHHHHQSELKNSMCLFSGN